MFAEKHNLDSIITALAYQDSRLTVQPGKNSGNQRLIIFFQPSPQHISSSPPTSMI